MRDTRRLVAALVTGVSLSAVAAGWAATRGASAPADNPTPAPSASHSAPTVASGPTTTVLRPIDVPDDPYAPEPVQRIGTMEIPKIGLKADIYHGITLRNIDFGPSHWPGTALPGESGNAVFAGHRVTHTHPFRDIDQLVPGDKATFTVNGVTSTYVVTGHEIVTPDALDIVRQTPAPTATLFACHPPHSATHRYVVHLALLSQ
jgi:sortase A